jgi:hypothetical protein
MYSSTIRDAENRSSATRRQLALSSAVARLTISAASSMPLARNPVAPWSSISGIDPRAKAIVGVPHIIDSTTESPNGHDLARIGLATARASFRFETVTLAHPPRAHPLG